jgi:hypothetical protein
MVVLTPPENSALVAKQSEPEADEEVGNLWSARNTNVAARQDEPEADEEVGNLWSPRNSNNY